MSPLSVCVANTGVGAGGRDEACLVFSVRGLAILFPERARSGGGDGVGGMYLVKYCFCYVFFCCCSFAAVVSDSVRWLTELIRFLGPSTVGEKHSLCRSVSHPAWLSLNNVCTRPRLTVNTGKKITHSYDMYVVIDMSVDTKSEQLRIM